MDSSRLWDFSGLDLRLSSKWGNYLVPVL